MVNASLKQLPVCSELDRCICLFVWWLIWFQWDNVDNFLLQKYMPCYRAMFLRSLWSSTWTWPSMYTMIYWGWQKIWARSTLLDMEHRVQFINAFWRTVSQWQSKSYMLSTRRVWRNLRLNLRLLEVSNTEILSASRLTRYHLLGIFSSTIIWKVAASGTFYMVSGPIRKNAYASPLIMLGI